MNYSDVNRLMSNVKFKDEYKYNCNRVMKIKGEEYGQYVFHIKNNLFGLIDEHGRWCWRNTINTHPNCFLSLYNFYLELGGEPIDFFDESEMSKNIYHFWSFLEDHWLLIFTDKINTKYYHELRLKTNKSWSLGQVTTIAFLSVLREIFVDQKIRKIDFSLDRGDINDFKGIDVLLITNFYEQITIQVKNGSFDERSSVYRIQSSINDLRSQSSHYCFVDMYNNDVIIFRNDKNLIESYPNLFLFPKELYVKNVKFNDMTVSKILHEMLIFCAGKKIVFDLINSENGENKINYESTPEKILTINISDFKDEKLYNTLDLKYKELQQLLN
jgi:hypothetical protein